MSWLLFNQKVKQIEIYEGKAPNYCAKQYPSKKGDWSAHNDVATKSKGFWPSGVFAWSHYNLHSDMGRVTEREERQKRGVKSLLLTNDYRGGRY
ncbi:MAG: hypothetical protein HS132_14580 [Planctomycetia bacterium]|nr:hypothetical protein [Planctomycetia bacterium]